MSKVGLIAACTFSIGIALGLSDLFVDKPAIVSRGDDDQGRYVDLISAPYQLDRVYMSMQGPRGNQDQIRLDVEASRDETLWLTGIETVNVDAQTGNLLSNEFFCHSNLTFCPRSITPEDHNSAFPAEKHMEWRLFTLIPGRMKLHLPNGFGIPIKGQTEVDYFTMALNQNVGPNRETRMKTRLFYQDDSASGQMRPLFRRGLYVYQQHKQPEIKGVSYVCDGRHQGEYCAASSDQDLAGETASTFQSVQLDREWDQHPGAMCCVANASKDGVTEQFGEANTVHWMVPPGVHQYRTDVTKQLQLPFDTTVHYVTGHLHPYGKSLALVDVDRGEMIFEITAKDYDDRKGIQCMSKLESFDGISIRRDGHYELVATYHNTTATAIDAMGILYFYALDAKPVVSNG